MAATLIGPCSWSLSRDDEGHREYTVKFKVKTALGDGPFVALECPGLPTTGTYYAIENDIDSFAFFYPTAKVMPHQEKDGEKARIWIIEMKASTRPLKRCQDTKIEDPLLEPQKVSGGFSNYTQEIHYDRFGYAATNSAHERLKGQPAEFDFNRPTVKIEQNVANLQLALFSSMINTVNDAPLWGLPARCIKLSNAPWERKYNGSCNAYYTRSFEFDISYETWDKDLMDEGTKVLNGHWATDSAADQARRTGTGDSDNNLWLLDPIPGSGGTMPDKNNPAHFIKAVDRQNNPIHMILNGQGQPVAGLMGTGVPDTGATLHLEHYAESNFLLLGIPTTL